MLKSIMDGDNISMPVKLSWKEIAVYAIFQW